MVLNANNNGSMAGNPSLGRKLNNSQARDSKGAGRITSPSLIEWNGLKFLVMDAPRPSNIHLYIKRLREYNVSHLVRVCERMYDAEEVEAAGITVHEMEYNDGSAPPEEVISNWLNVVETVFGDSSGNDIGSHNSEVGANNCIAVHCVAGLGRAPVLVAIACIEHGMAPIETVDYIRKRRRGAINAKQLAYLSSYIPRTKSKKCCIIS